MSQTSTAATPDAPSPTPSETTVRKGMQGHPWLTLLAVAFGVMMVALDGTVVGIANPAISKDLDASLADLQWVTNGYLLALAVCLIPAGKLGDRYGHKTIFLIGAAGFATTSLLIAFSQSVTMLIAFRVLQGVFGALLQPTALGLLRNSFPGNKLNMAIGIWGAAISTATAAGPIVGGLLVEHVSWQSVFYINVPIGVLTLVVGAWALANSRVAGASNRIDYLGVGLLSVAMFCLVWGVIKSGEKGWGSAYTLSFMAGTLILLALFALWQTRAPEPLMPLVMFRNRSFSIGIVLMIFMAFAMFGAMFFITFYLQGVNGLSPTETGVRMLPMSVVMMIGSPIGGFAITKLGPRIPIIAGLALSATAMALLARLGEDASFGATMVPFVLLGFGLSPIMVGATDIIVGNASLELSGVASGIQQAAMQVGGALGTAVLGAVVAAEVSSALPDRWPAVAGDYATMPRGQREGIEGSVAQGFPPLKPELLNGKTLDGPAMEAVRHASNSTFLDGMQLAFTIAAITMAVGIVLALFVRPGEKREGAVAVHV
ncbi:MFS transporter [Embleya sp. AB8]|uniref:MFS transporter n=1 Tax=Embleya sp. AB8 TaxID=3156304 RepID=UPI003C792FE2